MAEQYFEYGEAELAHLRKKDTEFSFHPSNTMIRYTDEKQTTNSRVFRERRMQNRTQWL